MSQYRNRFGLLMPADEATPVWRYVDFAKYVAMLKDQALHCARLDTLDDPFEGTLTRKDFDLWQEISNEAAASGEFPDSASFMRPILESFRRLRAKSYVCCWHMNTVESEAMWKLYAPAGFGIAIKSTYSRLLEAITLPDDCRDETWSAPSVGLIQYVDFESGEFPKGDPSATIMHKRLAFQHESECRMLVHWLGDSVRPYEEIEKAFSERPLGVNVKANIAALVDKVVVSPLAPTWFTSTVAHITLLHGFHFDVVQSSLIGQPLV